MIPPETNIKNDLLPGKHYLVFIFVMVILLNYAYTSWNNFLITHYFR